jgi:Uncharacterised nucleotidyltransferase
VSGAGPARQRGWRLPRDCWPTPRQERLLRAALVEGGAAERAWEEWVAARVDGEPLDPGSARLFPLVVARLGARRSEDATLSRLSERQQWARARLQLFLKVLSGAVEVLEAAGIETLLLKGAALALRHYPEPATRPMSDLDVLVPASRVQEAAALLASAGFAPHAGIPGRARLVTSHAMPFARGPGLVLDLHWHVFYECRWPDADDDLWRAAEDVELLGTRSRALGAADQLMHVISHGLRWSVVPSIRWVPDAVMVVRHSPGLDWDRLLDQAQRRRLVPPLGAGLEYLAARMELPLPSGVLERAHSLPSSRLERLAFEAQTRAPTLRGPRLSLAFHWDGLRRVSQSRAVPPGLPVLRAYLAETWGTSSLLRAPLLAAAKGLRRLMQMAAWRVHPPRSAPPDAA